MSRLKLKRFRVKPPLPEVQATYLRDYDPAQVYHLPHEVPPISSPALFGNDHPLSLDLGCGRGDFLITQAAEHPAENFVGIDWHLKSLWDAMHKAQRATLDNVRLIKVDFRLALTIVPDESVREVFLLFPPPMLLHKRINADPLPEPLLPQIHRVLAPGGWFHFVTDHPEYFEIKRALIEGSGLFTLEAESQAFEGGITWFQRFWEGHSIESKRLACRKQ